MKWVMTLKNFLRTSSVFAVNLFPCFLRVNKKSINYPTNFDERLSLKLSLTNKVKEHSALSKTPQSQEVHFGEDHKNALSHAGTFRNYSILSHPIVPASHVTSWPRHVMCSVYAKVTPNPIQSSQDQDIRQPETQKLHYSSSNITREMINTPAF